MKRLILAGGGHAHLAVLHHLAKYRPKGLSTTLVTPSSYQHYSGMLPGWMAGVYPLEKIRIDLRPLCAAAGVELIESSVVGMDADRRCVALPSRGHLEYDLLSLDVGSETDSSWFEDVGSNLLAVKPLDDFVAAWSKWIGAARRHQRHHQHQQQQHADDQDRTTLAGGVRRVVLRAHVQFARLRTATGVLKTARSARSSGAALRRCQST